MTDRMKWAGLGLLVVFWILLGYRQVIEVPSQQEVPLKYQSGQAAPVARHAGGADVWEVPPLTAPDRDLPGMPKKNIFAALTLVRQKSSQATAVALTKKPHTSATPAAVAPPAPETPPPPSPEELARQQEALRQQQLREQMGQYRYLGYVNQNGVQKAFLGKGREIHILQQGDTLDGQFEVRSIDPTRVTITDAASKLETVLTLKKDESSLSGT